MSIAKKIGDLFFFSRRRSIKFDDISDNSEENSLLCRFVLDGSGKKVGESIAIDNDIIIIKDKNNYLGVPLKHIEEDDKILNVKGLIDHNKAKELGEKWRKTSFNEINYNKGATNGF